MIEPVTIGPCTLYCGDAIDVLPQLQPGSVDAVVCDPPYGVDFQGKNTKHTKRIGQGYATTEDAENIVPNVVLPILSQCFQLCDRVVVTPGTRNVFRYPEPREMGSIFYPSGAGLGRWGFICSQPILYYGKCPYLANGMGHRPNGFQTVESAEENGHPCPKPVGVMRWLVLKASAFEGETILDPFAGSGTTGVACVKEGRRFIGIEKDADYFEIACRQIRKAVREERSSLFPARRAVADQRSLLPLEVA